MSQYWMKARDPISSFTHMIGAVFFAIATVLLVCKTLIFPAWSVKVLVGVILFGCSLVALYSASSIYHFFNRSGKKLMILRKLDHAMIYVLIAGTYTPILLKYLPALESEILPLPFGPVPASALLSSCAGFLRPVGCKRHCTLPWAGQFCLIFPFFSL